MNDTAFLLAMMGPVGAFISCMLLLLVIRWQDRREAARAVKAAPRGHSPRHTPAE